MRLKQLEWTVKFYFILEKYNYKWVITKFGNYKQIGNKIKILQNESPLKKLLMTVRNIKKEPLTVEEEREIEILGTKETYLSYEHAQRIAEMKKENNSQDCGYVYSPTTNRFVSNNKSLLNHPPPPEEIQALHIGQMQNRQQKYNNFNSFRDSRNNWNSQVRGPNVRKFYRGRKNTWGQPDNRFGIHQSNYQEPKILAKRGFEELSPTKCRPVAHFKGRGGSQWMCAVREDGSPPKKTRMDANNNIQRHQNVPAYQQQPTTSSAWLSQNDEFEKAVEAECEKRLQGIVPYKWQ